MAYYNPTTPPLVLKGTVNTVTPKELYGVSDGTGLSNIPITYTVNIDGISSQIVGDETVRTNTLVSYNGIDVKVGDFIAQITGSNEGRKVFKIIDILNKTTNTFTCVIEDVDMFVARSVAQKDNELNGGESVIIFEVNEQNQPIIYRGVIQDINVGVYTNIISYFNTYNPLYSRRFFQDPAPNFTLSDNVTVNSSGEWIKATSGDTILGQVSKISTDPRTFYVRPINKIIDNFEYPQGLTGGSIGDIWYSDPDVDGGYTTTKKEGSTPLFFQISDATPTTVIATSEFTLLSGEELILNNITGATGVATQSQVVSQVNSGTSQHYVVADEYSSIASDQTNGTKLQLSQGPIVPNSSINGGNNFDITISDGTNSANIVFSGTGNINITTGESGTPNGFAMQDTTNGDGVVTILNNAFTINTVNAIAEVIDESTGTQTFLKSIKISSTVAGETITITTNVGFNGVDFAASGTTDSMVGITNLIEPEIQNALRLTRNDGGDILITGSDSVINKNGVTSSSNGNPPLLQILTSGGGGESGSSGSSGSSGTSGTSGSSGAAGSSGSSGTSGTSGSSGAAGSSGSSGTSGTSGSSGAAGSSGSSGTSGTSGSSGVDGIGLRGSDGSSGSSGTSGTSGSSGAAGSSGSSGSSGTSGTSGSSGAAGSSGSSGTSGTSGSSGADGSSGSSGTSGTSGSSGTSGTSGQGSGTNYFFNSSITEIGSYLQLSTNPVASAETTSNVTVPALSTGTTIASYVSTEFGFTIIPGGVQHFNLWFTKDGINDDLEVFVELYLANSSGVIQGFIGTSQSTNIGWNNNNTTPVYVNTDITLPTSSVNSTDRMVAIVKVKNIDNQLSSATFYTQGSSHYSYVTTTIGAQGGTSGSSGTSGTSGSSGAAGSSGSSGTSGTSGSSGAAGSSGSSGSSGTSGTSGSSGVSVDVYDDTTLISSGVSEITFSGESVSVVTGSTEDSVIVTITGGTSLSVSANTGVELTETDVLYTIYNTNLSPTLEMDTNVGGIDSGTLVSDLTGKTFVELFNDLLFPTVQPTYTPSSLTFVGSPSTSTVEVGSTVNVDFYGKGIKNDAGDFTTIRLLKNGIVQYTDSVLTISSESPIANQFGYLNPNTPNSGFTSDSWSETLTVPSPSAGNTQTTTTYTVNGDYNAGLPKKDNKGDDDIRTALTRNTNRPQAAQNNYSPGNKTVTGIYPYFWGKASTNKPTISDIQTAISGGTANKVLAKASNDITITYNAVDEFLWFAHFSEYNNKTNWVITPNTNEGTIGEQLIDSPIENQVIDGPDGYWSGINFDIYISSYATTTVSPITFE